MSKTLSFLTASLLTLFAALPAAAEDANHLQQLLSTGDCPGCDLRGAGLVFADLPGADLTGADLRGANLSQANLAAADLTQANLAGASLHSANLSNASLLGANVVGTDLRRSILSQANLWGTRLDLAAIQGAIGLPASFERAENYYALGVVAGNNRSYIEAINYYNRAIQLDNEFAAAYLGRALMRLSLVDEAGAAQDAVQAAALFNAQENTQGEEMALALVEYIDARQNPGGGGSGLGIDLLNSVKGIGGSLLRLLL
ncbi:MAG: pentapeptide repeat-containing protein [Cyanobacteria bacterium P01_G01_bin.54]